VQETREVRRLRAEANRRQEDFVTFRVEFQSRIEEVQDRAMREIQKLRARVQCTVQQSSASTFAPLAAKQMRERHGKS
jgi:hypothetical protein